MAKDWIKSAVKRPGALRSKAKKAGLVKKGENLSSSDLSKMDKKAKAKGDTKTEKQVSLARTFKKMRK